MLNEDVTVALGVDQIHNIVLSSSTEKGYVGGQVFDAFGHPIVGPLFVSGGETNCPIGAAGEYFLELDPGIQMITANPKGAFFNPDYAEVIANVLSRLGDVPHPKFWIAGRDPRARIRHTGRHQSASQYAC